ncbi:housekeeping sortase [Corynebacterium phocae]|uniref:Housekeeping sortase n=1 Tax=Corynebacterium phocae TaxID=161895 RepID=A0A1L7D5Y2_9CORY|nr:class E sortase [Corynebacterium phocae]APT93451.1 housekeeping sortase [Corynebacterium phocae]KAA8721144.1 class E sortase [Corynebacterium phocae]
MKARRQSKLRPTQVLGELMLTAGVLLLLFAFYESFWTNLESAQLQKEAAEELSDSWGEEDAWVNPRGKVAPELGEAFARLYIPTFGSDYHFAVVEGTKDEHLLVGPGRYVDSQLPGQHGNFAVAGHRVGKGAPFNDLGNLQTCDAIVVETQTEWITYRVLPIGGVAADCLNQEQQAKLGAEYAGVQGLTITHPGDVAVIDPVPGTQVTAQEASEGLITLTTCHPQFSNAERMIVHAMETSVEPKQPGQRPAVLEEK